MNMNLKNNYDAENPLSIEEYSQELIGKTFEDVLMEFFNEDNEAFIEARERFNNPYRKGSLGNLIEEYFFGYPPNSSPEPDFPEAGVELKVTPYERTKTGKIRAGERLVLGMIPNNLPVPKSFEESSAYLKLELVLLIYYYRNRDLERVQYPIHYSQLVSLNSKILEKDLEIIKSDYEIIINKIKDGKAHELSEADTMYLGAATKGATAKKSLQSQYYNSNIKAKRRAFSLKQGYMTSFFNDYVAEEIQTYDEIVDEPVSVETFEELVINKIRSYTGYSKDELIKKFDLTVSKDIFSRIALKILNIDTENAEEFEKSNTQIKTIRIEENGKIREHMSFPTISLVEFAEEEWENSYFYELFSETRFLFVVYRKNGGIYYLEDALFWHMPNLDLEEIAHKEWLEIQNEVRDGVEFKVTEKNVVYNSLPNASKTKITHLRPHTSKAAYHVDSLELKKGEVEKHGDILPNGDIMTKQAFWLNKDYVKEQIEKHMK